MHDTFSQRAVIAGDTSSYDDRRWSPDSIVISSSELAARSSLTCHVMFAAIVFHDLDRYPCLIHPATCIMFQIFRGQVRASGCQFRTVVKCEFLDISATQLCRRRLRPFHSRHQPGSVARLSYCMFASLSYIIMNIHIIKLSGKQVNVKNIQRHE